MAHVHIVGELSGAVRGAPVCVHSARADMGYGSAAEWARRRRFLPLGRLLRLLLQFFVLPLGVFLGRRENAL